MISPLTIALIAYIVGWILSCIFQGNRIKELIQLSKQMYLNTEYEFPDYMYRVLFGFSYFLLFFSWWFNIGIESIKDLEELKNKEK